MAKEVEVVEEACEACEACAPDDPLSMLVGNVAEEIYNVALSCETPKAEVTAIVPSPRNVTTVAPPIPSHARDNVAHYLWTPAGIDSLKKQEMWEAYGRPEVGNEVEASH